jgi:hypothetical protein
LLIARATDRVARVLLEDGLHDEHPAGGDEMSRVIREALDLLARLFCPAIYFGDFGD